MVRAKEDKKVCINCKGYSQKLRYCSIKGKSTRQGDTCDHFRTVYQNGTFNIKRVDDEI